MPHEIRVNPRRIQHDSPDPIPPRPPEDQALVMARDIYGRTWDYVEAHQITLDETPRVETAFGALIAEIQRLIAERDEARVAWRRLAAFAGSFSMDIILESIATGELTQADYAGPPQEPT